MVIPCRNDAKLLDATLHTLDQQTVQPDQIMVVDNASADDTQQVTRNHGANLVFKPRPGVTWAARRL